MTHPRKLIRGLNRILRDSLGTSSMVERFDVMGALLYLRSLSPCAEPDVQEVRTLAARQARKNRRVLCWPDGAIPLDDETLDACVQAICASTGHEGANDLLGAAYEELLAHTFDKGDNQQFFTPRSVVQFMVDLAAPRLSGRICDPACGTGGLLTEAVRRLQDAKDAGLEVVGMEVDERLARAARMNLQLAGHPRFSIHTLGQAGALAPGIPASFPPFDAILTNPPFGSDTTSPEALEALQLGRGRSSRRRGVLFVERCLELVRPGGTVCIVVDDSITTGGSCVDVRRLVLDRAHVRAVVALPETTFMPYASVRTSILLLQRRRRGLRRGPTFFARSDDGADDLRAISSLHARRAAAPGAPRHFTAELPSTGDARFARHGLRLDPEYHGPEGMGTRRQLVRSAHPVHPLSSLCEVRQETVSPARDLGDVAFSYVALSDMEPHTGKLTARRVQAHSVRGPLRVFEPGDILYSRLRPALRKVCLVPPSAGRGLASPECVVLVARSGRAPVMLPELLAHLLRSDLVLHQVMHLVTGIGRPRLSRRAILDIRLPVPPSSEQRRLLEELSVSRAEADEMRHRAGQMLARADARLQEAERRLLEDLLSEGRDPSCPPRSR